MSKVIIHETKTNEENAELNASTLSWRFYEGSSEFVYDEWFEDNYENKVNIENKVNSKEFRELSYIRIYHYFKQIVLEYIMRSQ